MKTTPEELQRRFKAVLAARSLIDAAQRASVPLTTMASTIKAHAIPTPWTRVISDKEIRDAWQKASDDDAAGETLQISVQQFTRRRNLLKLSPRIEGQQLDDLVAEARKTCKTDLEVAARVGVDINAVKDSNRRTGRKALAFDGQEPLQVEHALFMTVYNETASDTEAGKRYPGGRQAFASRRRAAKLPNKGRKMAVTNAARRAAHARYPTSAEAARANGEPLATHLSALARLGLEPKYAKAKPIAGARTRRQPENSRIKPWEDAVRRHAHATFGTDIEAADYCGLALPSWFAWKRKVGLGPVCGPRVLNAQEANHAAREASERNAKLMRNTNRIGRKERLRRIKVLAASQHVNGAAIKLGKPSGTFWRWFHKQGFPAHIPPDRVGGVAR